MMPLGSHAPALACALAAVCLVLMTGALFLVAGTWRLGLPRRRLVDVCLVAGAACCYTYLLTMAGIYPLSQGSVVVGPPGPLVALPTLLVVVPLPLLALYELQFAQMLRCVRQGQVTPNSVKEALDTLPDGVCFARPDGRLLLANARMQALAREALGLPLNDGQALWSRLEAGDCLPGYTVERPEVWDGQTRLPEAAGRRLGLLLHTPEGAVWEFTRSELAMEDGPAVEVIAVDVSEEYALAAELARRNGRLAEVNRRLRAYGSDLVRLTREEEVLAAKVRVHDDVGRALVALRSYERQDPGQRDRASLLRLWQKVITLLQSAGADEEPHEDPWELLAQAAEAVDVRIVLEGALPEDEELRAVVVALVHECLNNAVRHADAHELRVQLDQGPEETCVRITNDGRPPAAAPAETGGLANLRRMVEGCRGSMELSWQPRFVLQARFAQAEGGEGRPA